MSKKNELIKLCMELAKDKELTKAQAQALDVAAKLLAVAKPRVRVGKSANRPPAIHKSRAQELYEKASKPNGHQEQPS